MTSAYLDASIKSYNINQLQTGDLVKFQADIMPVIYHYGIIDRVGNNLYLYHNQPNFINRNGGSLIREDFKKYAKGRKIVEIQKTGLTNDDLAEMTEILQDKKYNFVSNNCEHFINGLRENKFISPQVIKWTFGLTVVVISIIVLTRKK